MMGQPEREERHFGKIGQDEMVLKLQALSKESLGTGPDKVAQTKYRFRYLRS
jgi:hypothetical protein